MSAWGSNSNVDWDKETVIGRNVRRGNSGPRQNVAKSQSQVNQARRTGGVVSVDKKYFGGANKKGDAEGQRLTKVDRSDEIVKPKTIDLAVGKTISKIRLEKKLTQKDLATKINEKPTVINDYEAGRAIPVQSVLAKLERVLGVKLRGKDIGQPLFQKKEKK
ncbi:multiprotein-bridging factor 1 [Ascoidea rubescens DSM 1968]|uniref:MBF1-domain-containing protein n=1 Tax=Ascoidea rubescens DSM 1968 TaxID=1344418 RepID=A0A1D2VJI7_9ASCO|nr:MBF1-domain-containing protein [Ascoidea rubescens DSM 1968]ODV61784.1 MBF1-domain-containing protein [Ascoidea rubescens DSM 1968]